jgi:hypothetical protein
MEKPMGQRPLVWLCVFGAALTGTGWTRTSTPPPIESRIAVVERALAAPTRSMPSDAHRRARIEELLDVAKRMHAARDPLGARWAIEDAERELLESGAEEPR